MAETSVHPQNNCYLVFARRRMSFSDHLFCVCAKQPFSNHNKPNVPVMISIDVP